MEGGSLDRHGKTLNSVEDSIRNGRPISLAGDQFGNFGQRCNKSPSQSCLMLVCYQNFDRVFSNYRARFPGVQKNCLIGVVVDTGDAFNGTSGRKIDVATEDIVKARTLSGPGRYFEIESAGCNSGSGDKRACLVNNLQASCVPGDRNVAGTRSLQKTAAVR